MTIDLKKGARVDLQKEAPGLVKLKAGLGWKPNPTNTGGEFDLDVSVFVCKLDANGDPKLIANEYFVFYNNKKTPDDSVIHSGDNRTGDGEGDDETISIDLSKLPAEAAELSFVVTIHEADVRKQNFGQVSKSYIRLINETDNAELAKYALEDDFSAETAVQFGSLYKNNEGHWAFKAVGVGYTKGLQDFVNIYGGA